MLFVKVDGNGCCDESEVGRSIRETQITIRDEGCDRDVGNAGVRIEGGCVQGCVQDGGEIAECVELEVEEQVCVARIEYACAAPVQRIGFDGIVHGFPKTIVTLAVAQIFYTRAKGHAEEFAGFGCATEFVAVFAGAFEFGSGFEVVTSDPGSSPGQAPLLTGFSIAARSSFSGGALLRFSCRHNFHFLRLKHPGVGPVCNGVMKLGCGVGARQTKWPFWPYWPFWPFYD